MSAKAAKHDDAEIYTGIWDSRISSVLPCSSATLLMLRNACFGWWTRRVYRSFCAYLIRQHGSGRCSRLTEAHLVRRAGSLTCQRQGGKKRKRRINTNKNKNNTQTKWSNQVPTDLAMPSFDLSSLIRDVESGRKVLYQVLASEWRDWTEGSSLLFWRWDNSTQVALARDGMEIFVQGTLST